jgi:hypothetical protein
LQVLKAELIFFLFYVIYLYVTIYILHRRFEDSKIKETGRSRFVDSMGEMRKESRNLVEEGRDHVQNAGMDRRILLKQI